MKLYEIEYENKFVQYLNLISDEDYQNIKFLKARLNSIDLAMQSTGKKNKLYKELEKEYDSIKKEINSFGNWFIKNSPLGEAIFNGTNLMRLPKHQGGDHKIFWKYNPNC